MSRRWAVLIAGASLCVVAIAVLLVARYTSDASATFPAEQADQLQAALTSPSLDDQAAALDPGIADLVRRAGKPLLASGAVVKIDPATFIVTGPGVAHVDATLDGPMVRLFLAEQPDQRWLVYATAAWP